MGAAGGGGWPDSPFDPLSPLGFNFLAYDRVGGVSVRKGEDGDVLLRPVQVTTRSDGQAGGG